MEDKVEDGAAVVFVLYFTKGNGRRSSHGPVCDKSQQVSMLLHTAAD